MDTMNFVFVKFPPVVASHNHNVKIIEVPTYCSIISFTEAVTTIGDALNEVLLLTTKGVVALNNAGIPEVPPLTTTYAYMVVLAAVALLLALKDQAIFHLKPD